MRRPIAKVRGNNMTLSKEFIRQTRELLFSQLIQAYDLHHSLSDKLFSVDSINDHILFHRLYRISDKAYERSQRRYEAYKAFRVIEERELKALENSEYKSKIIHGWQHSNINTLPSALISVTETGQEIRYPVGGLYSEISYKWKRIRGARKNLYTKGANVLSKRYFPLPIEYQYSIVPVPAPHKLPPDVDSEGCSPGFDMQRNRYAY
jgi:hypothetical protein